MTSSTISLVNSLVSDAFMARSIASAVVRTGRQSPFAYLWIGVVMSRDALSPRACLKKKAMS
jgi:hypothetical protein